MLSAVPVAEGFSNIYNHYKLIQFANFEIFTVCSMFLPTTFPDQRRQIITNLFREEFTPSEGRVVDWSNNVKFLEITLDGKLLWIELGQVTLNRTTRSRMA